MRITYLKHYFDFGSFRTSKKINSYVIRIEYHTLYIYQIIQQTDNIVIIQSNEKYTIKESIPLHITPFEQNLNLINFEIKNF